MSDESPHLDCKDKRPLRHEEYILLNALLSNYSPYLGGKLKDICVADMQDGQMGSICVATNSNEKRQFGRTFLEAEYVDIDEVLVKISINLDNEGKLYEVDFWKVDFSPLKRYPSFDQLRKISLN